MQYGYFDDDAREYVITNPKTPVKWINYIGTLAFGGFVDHTGGALLCKGDPSLNRITRYIAQLPASEFKGETLYLRVKNEEGYSLFSPYFVPTLDALDHYECRVGLGYTRIISSFKGIATDAVIFVPLDESVELRLITVSNQSRATKEIDCVPVVEYSHPDALKQFTNADWVPQTMQSKCVRGDDGRTILTQYPFMCRGTKLNYFTSNCAASSFETDRARFLGDNEYGSWARPGALDDKELSDYEALRGDNIAALLHHFGQVRPGETRTIVTQLGQEASVQAIQEKSRKYRDPASVSLALTDLSRFWNAYLSRMQVVTPDLAMNRMLNIHNPRQCFITFNWSRYLSLYQLAYGSRELGFRDSSQDVMGIMDRVPDRGKGLLIKLLSVQKKNGSALHQFNPLTMVGNEGDSLERGDLPHYYSDDHLWSVLAVCAYVKETGDFDFLEESVPFYEKDPSGAALEKAPVLEHLQRALAFTWNDRGKHGLPLLGFADWNDTVNLKVGAESSFTACLFGKALLEMIGLARYLSNPALIKKCTEYYEAMKKAFNEHAWDGKWYVRYFDHDGSVLGTHKNEQGKIYINSQSWPVLAGFAPPDRAISALESVFERLNTPKGIKLSAPGFNGFDPAKGGITTYPPGAKENGGIFLHTNPWVMIAEAIMGNGERAYEYYCQINPAAKNDCIDEFQCEPYVYPQNILGNEHPQFGLARNSWLSGTSSWTYQAATQFILGIRPSYKGLCIDPCIPRDWDGFSVTRVFRNTTYRITVKNPRHKGKGDIALKVDGLEIVGPVVPVFADAKEHQVEAVIM
jgi:cellobiose phosphorylase